ncbi:glycerophosphodiester phosphodiesterase family protein [Gelidibacter gilvus]|uniref:Glycerophosphodiester phosphodiesterase n=1 Tax=Gelidibacter gilvus TaxID=59602 RepID=A0A4Q0XGA4_9FLAO|nr:glycerophosphodiester phosphodiesterase family protein [Gelidibacter gilvus]RXJ45746.1 glycerophosphodiester phosphodiesterase [Gelidibacter gilvus]
MKTLHKLTALLIILTIGCKSNSDNEIPSHKHKTEVQGHRGDRGNLPENTIEGFLSALHKGVDVIELDVVITKDHKVVVSHEPNMSSLYMSKPSGDPILKSEENSYNLYQMTYDSIKYFDSGSRENINFPDQQKLKTFKPLLSDVFSTIENEIKEKRLPLVKYNIELKSDKKDYGIYQPHPEDFVSLVMQVVHDSQLENQINIQSFDPVLLNIVHKWHPLIEIAYLVSNAGIQKNLRLLNFKPQIYSPNFKLLKTQKIVDSIKSLHMKVIPWTVNNEEDIEQMVRLHVDGIITDYPERVLKALQ